MRYWGCHLDPGHIFLLVRLFIQLWIGQLHVILFEVFLLRLGTESSVSFLIEYFSQLDFTVVLNLFVRESS